MADATLKIAVAISNVVCKCIGDYVGYIANYDTNLLNLRAKLSEVVNEKDAIDEKVERGKDELRKITKKASSWLKDVRILTEDPDIISLMKKDVETAKHVVNLMEKDALKRLVREDAEMQKVVIKVMKRLKKEVAKAPTQDDMKKFTEGDYKRVIQVVVEVMKDTTDEFKMIMKNDQKVAEMAIQMLKDKDLEKLSKDDAEMARIVNEAQNHSGDDDEEDKEDKERVEDKPRDKDEKEEGDLSKGEGHRIDNNALRKVAKRLVTPLEYLLTGLRNVTADENFKKAVPQAESATLLVDVIKGLVVRGGWQSTNEMDNDDNDSASAQQNCCGWTCNVSAGYFHNRYKLSVAAENMAKHIQDDILANKCPGDQVTVPMRQQAMETNVTGFTKDLESREVLLKKILKKLTDDKVDIVGLHGMGGAGKTMMAKDVILRAESMFDIKVMVEVSNAPDIRRIQEVIAESIDLPLHDLHDLAQRGRRLRTRLTLEKERRILIVMDNIWRKLDTQEVGVPPNCKLLLTTRDKEICRVMGVNNDNTFEVGVLNGTEARKLFESHAGSKVNDREYKVVTDRLLRKCAGLPLAIVATANALKDKDLVAWQKFADELSKPISSQINGVNHDTYMIMETSFLFMGSEEKMLFFLLACLSPLGSSVSIEELMRFGIGLDLFQHVDKLSEAMEQAYKWADDLVSSSMLLKSDSKEHVQIHDVTRASGIFSAPEVAGHKFMVEAIPRWLNEETFRMYTAISLQSNDYSRLNGVKADKLQILLLKGDLSPDFDDSFFKGMTNLQVLSLSNMNFETKLPESMRKLEKLRTLHLEGCKLGDIKAIGELVNLLVLSLRGSFCREGLPNELGELRSLRLLDLTTCSCKKLKPLIPARVLERLSKLEGLYMLDSFTEWAHSAEQESGDHGESSNNIASAIELQSLRYLNALEMHIPKAPQLPLDGQFLRNLDKYRITFGYTELSGDIQQFHRVSSCRGIDFSKDSISCVKALSNNADWLRLRDIDLMTTTLVPEIDYEGFKDLVHLEVGYCKNLVHMVRVEEKNNDLVAFPQLESLKLYDLESLRSFCDEKGLSGMFPNLKHISLSWMPSLEYMMPLSVAPYNLTDFEASCCYALKFVFLENTVVETSYSEPGMKDERGVTVFPFLRSLELNGVNCQSLLGLIIENNLQGHQVFFNKKVGFPSLELISLSWCRNIRKLWSEDAGFCGFQNLREISIEHCVNLSSLGPRAVFCALVNLQTLIISDCGGMQQVITEETNEGELGDRKISFPMLTVLQITSANNLECFYGGKYQMEFPCLKELKLKNVSSMNRFAGSENSLSAAFFHEKVEFPSLVEFALDGATERVKGLWNWDALPEEVGVPIGVESNPVPMLRTMVLGKREALWSIPSMICNNLSSLELGSFNNEVVFSSSVTPPSSAEEKSNFRWKSSMLPKLEELCIMCSESLRELFEKEDVSIDSPAAMFFGQLKGLRLIELPRLNLIPLHLFKGLRSLCLHTLKWEYLISADVVRVHGSLQQLQVLEIMYCDSLRVIIDGEVETPVDSVFEFPQLKQLKLDELPALVGFSSTPALESLQISSCREFHKCWWWPISALRLKDVDLSYCEKVETLFSTEHNCIIELPSLEVVETFACHRLRSLSSGPLITPKLQRVMLSCCRSMERLSLGNPNQDDVVELPYLKELEIEGCHGMQSFSSRPIIAPNLAKVVLIGCSSMQWLLSENTNHNDAVADFPFLETLKISNCPKMQSFCCGVLQAPKLTHVIYNREKYSMLEIGDLNQFLRTHSR